MLLVIGTDKESDWESAMGDCCQQLFNLALMQLSMQIVRLISPLSVLGRSCVANSSCKLSDNPFHNKRTSARSFHPLSTMRRIEKLAAECVPCRYPKNV